ncbi:MAG: hypothetical protein LBI70_02870 [Rickettsiales bacterium]|nr:hypothetical protein [Rickettsiales bacterium]
MIRDFIEGMTSHFLFANLGDTGDSNCYPRDDFLEDLGTVGDIIKNITGASDKMKETKNANLIYKAENDTSDDEENVFLPPPDILAKYRNSGMARELSNFVKKEQEHRHEVQRDSMHNYRRGQTFGLISSLFFIWNTFSLIKAGHRKEAYVLCFAFSSLMLSMVLLTRCLRKNYRKHNEWGASPSKLKTPSKG